MVNKITNILGSVRFWGVVVILGIGVYVGNMEALEAVQALLGITVAVGTVDRLGEKIGGK